MTEIQKSRKPKWVLVLALICVLISAAIVVGYAITMNMVLGVAVLPFVGGAIYFYSKWNNIDYEKVKLTKDKIIKSGANCMTIYAEQTDDGSTLPKLIQFEHIPESIGIPRRFPQLNNEWLSVRYNIVESKVKTNSPFGAGWNDEDINTNKMREFILPDTQYSDPALMRFPLNMKATQDYFRIETSLFQQLKPWIMVAAIAVAGVILLAVG